MNSPPSWLNAKLRAFGASDALVLKLIRFGIVGALSSGLFAIVTAVCAGQLGIGPKLSSVLGYIASMPLNFIFNRRFSFRSDNAIVSELSKFVLIHALNILLTTLTMGTVVDVLGLHYAVGIVFVMGLVPLLNFALMNWWVFRTGVPHQNRH